MTAKPITNKPATDKPRTEYHIDVADHPNVMLWMKDAAKRDPQGFLRLVGDNTDIFRQWWGKEAWTNDGSKGWSYGWALYENNLHWMVLTGEQGTIFRLRVATKPEEYLSDPRVGVGVIQHLTHLLRTLSF